MREETGSERDYFGFVYQMAIESCKDIAGLTQAVAGSVPRVSGRRP
jgi:hypothetical protein